MNTPRTSAAILLPLLVDRHLDPMDHAFEARGVRMGRDTSVLFTVRTDLVEHHKGQISFPGGMFENEDQSLEHTALRETEEELGLPRSEIQLLGQLPETVTISSRFLITPFLGTISQNADFNHSADEIAEILKVPLHHLLDPTHSTLEKYTVGGVHVHVKAYRFHGHHIWGATARILQTFLEKELKILG